MTFVTDTLTGIWMHCISHLSTYAFTQHIENYYMGRKWERHTNLKSISLTDLCAFGSSKMMRKLGHSKILKRPSCN